MSYDDGLDEIDDILRGLDSRPKSVAPPRHVSSRSTTIDFNEIDDIINVLGSESAPQQHSYQQNRPPAQTKPVSSYGGSAFHSQPPQQLNQHYQSQPQQQHYQPAAQQQNYGGGGGGANNRNTLDNIDDLLRGLEGNRASVRAPSTYGGAHSGRSPTLNAQATSHAHPRPVTTKLSPSSSSNQKVYVSKPPSVRPVQGNDLDNLLEDITRGSQVNHSSPSVKGGCAACGRAILGENICALGKTYHPEHFVCGNCSRPLGTSNFFEQDGSPHCERCYQELICARCAHCEEPIMDKCVTALGKKWHLDHFICTHCLNPFPNGTYFEKDSRPYCDSCFSGNFNPRCAGCNQPIKGEITNALGQQWHPEHFVCQYCQKSFAGGSFYEYGGKPYCDIHYHQQTGSLCAGCGKAVTGKCINALDKKWHPEHFVCGFCMNPLNGGNYTENAGKAYCKDCHGKLFGQ